RGRLRSGYEPLVALIVPLKGLEPGLDLNLKAFATQDYVAYQLILVVASAGDPVYRWVNERVNALPAAAPRNACTIRIVVAGRSETRGEKVNNLLAGVAAADPAAQVFVFADSDATPGPDWLRSLVAPLAASRMTLSTGFRWYLPGPGLASQLRAAWDTSVATMLGAHDHNFAWGGSTAIRASDFKRLEVAERYWASTVSDDYALTRAVRERGGFDAGGGPAQETPGRIHFEPRCLVKSGGELSLAQFLRWANRQIIITRVYSPRLWWMGLLSYLLYCGTFIFGLTLLAMGAGSGAGRLAVAGLLAAVVAMGMIKAGVRTVVAREQFGGEEASLQRYGSRYWQLSPLVPWVMLFNFAVAAFVRRIEWRGVRYELRSANEVRVLK
ncbi:MAG TPA: glycosyltransferase, partial [Terriglobia bacterium]|nr:glycosyltransferase [Terriglobia bacterium]